MDKKTFLAIKESGTESIPLEEQDGTIKIYSIFESYEKLNKLSKQHIVSKYESGHIAIQLEGKTHDYIYHNLILNETYELTCFQSLNIEKFRDSIEKMKSQDSIEFEISAIKNKGMFFFQKEKIKTITLKFSLDKDFLNNIDISKYEVFEEGTKEFKNALFLIISNKTEQFLKIK